MKYSEELQSALKAVISSGLDLTRQEYNIADYKEKKAEHYKNLVEGNLKRIRDIDYDYYFVLLKYYKEGRYKEMIEALEDLKEIEPEQKKVLVPKLPEAIREEVTADIKELEKCLENGLLRSAVILCGRILETSLHRKYFELSGRDLLETSPGIGIGSLVAKLKEMNYNFDPGISEQIHLINQVRIYSVHKKQSPFSPTKEQAQAIILYTLDVIKKMF